MAEAARDPVLAELAELTASGVEVCLVHGGGPAIDEALERRGVRSRRIGGLRVTDAVTLEVTESVLCGAINKQLVRAAASFGIRAAGISGEDGNVLVARHAEPAALGYVGVVESSDPSLLEALFAARFMPIVAPLALASDGSSALNVNADLAASAIACALRAQAMVFITNVARVLADTSEPSSAIDRFSLTDAQSFVAKPACSDGMKPKLAAAIAAAAAGVPAYICKAGPRCIAAALSGEATLVEPNSGWSTWSSNASPHQPILKP